MRVLAALNLLMLPASAQFLIPDRAYRCPISDASCTSSHNLKSFEQRTTDKGSSFTINYVEVSDKGGYWHPQQIIDAIDQIGKAREGGAQKPLVLVYVHGWHNNADDHQCGTTPCDDVSKFRDIALAELANLFPPTAPGKTPPVVGIYLAWRGLTFTVEPFKHIVSYWPRRGVAHDIGTEAMSDAVDQIINKVKDHREDYFLLMVGHSFGARVLENAVEVINRKGQGGAMQKYRSLIGSRSNSTRESGAPDLSERSRAPVDLIFYANAATSSAVTRQTIADVKRRCETAPADPLCTARPMYIAVTSTADVPTGFVLPIANLIIPAIRTDKFHLISAANTPSLHTHHIQDCAPGEEPVECPPGSAFCFDAVPNQKHICYSARPIAGKSDTPFWIMNVNHNVMAGHGDIWNLSVLNMMEAVIFNDPKFQLILSNARNAARQ